VALHGPLKKSRVMLPIPGASQVDHLEGNAQAALLKIDDDLVKELEQSAAAPA
jgi:aryl-alcohol dehydrogenase-like predicted oxidoreductase